MARRDPANPASAKAPGAPRPGSKPKVGNPSTPEAASAEGSTAAPSEAAPASKKDTTSRHAARDVPSDAPRDAAGGAPHDPPSSPPTPPEAAELQAARAQVDDLRDKLLRARADYENLQKRVARDAALERERAKGRALESLLPVFEMAQAAAREAEGRQDAVGQGVAMMVREFERVLEREGVRAVGAVGEAFDAARHEAVGVEAADGVGPGRVSRVVRAGYLLGDRVLRPAIVLVAPEAKAQP